MQVAIKPRYVYICKIRYKDDSGQRWTVAEIDAAYLRTCMSRGELNPPPNEWYPMNSLGYSNYSITRIGTVWNNKLNRSVKGSLHRASMKIRFSLRHDNGDEMDEYTNRLVAKMFLPPPSDSSSTVLHWNDNTLDCAVSNLYWACDKNKAVVGTPFADKIVRLQSLVVQGIGEPHSSLPSDEVHATPDNDDYRWLLYTHIKEIASWNLDQCIEYLGFTEPIQAKLPGVMVVADCKELVSRQITSLTDSDNETAPENQILPTPIPDSGADYNGIAYNFSLLQCLMDKAFPVFRLPQVNIGIAGSPDDLHRDIALIEQNALMLLKMIRR